MAPVWSIRSLRWSITDWRSSLISFSCSEVVWSGLVTSFTHSLIYAYCTLFQLNLFKSLSPSLLYAYLQSTIWTIKMLPDVRLSSVFIPSCIVLTRRWEWSAWRTATRAATARSLANYAITRRWRDSSCAAAPSRRYPEAAGSSNTNCSRGYVPLRS